MPKVSRHKKSGKPIIGTIKRNSELVSEAAAHPRSVSEQALPNIDGYLRLAVAASPSVDNGTQDIRDGLGIGTFGMAEPPAEALTNSPLRCNIDIYTWTHIH